MNTFEEGLLKYFSKAQIEKIQKIRVGIAGAGGLGSNCAVNLARCGFNKFTIYDFDFVEASNLNRQFYFIDQIGKSKVEALKLNLSRINPDIAINAFADRITSLNAKEIFAGCDAVVEAFDKAEDKKMLAELYAESEKFYVSASGLAGWGNSDKIIVRAIGKTFYMIGDGKTEASQNTPPCAPRVNVAAAKEADCILDWVLKNE